MKRSSRYVYIAWLVLILVLVLGACSPAPTPVPPPTLTAVPTATSAPMVTTAPTATAVPAGGTAVQAVEAATTAAPTTVPANPIAAATTKTVCLTCHPFDRLAATANFDTGIRKISPHRYADPNSADYPHAETRIDAIPECTNCHTPHSLTALPAPGSIDLSMVTVNWCYDTCHHVNNFQMCANCHQNGGLGNGGD